MRRNLLIAVGIGGVIVLILISGLIFKKQKQPKTAFSQGVQKISAPQTVNTALTTLRAKEITSKAVSKMPASLPLAAGPDGFAAALKNAQSLEERGELLGAKDAYAKIMTAYVSLAGIEEVQKKLENLNMHIIVSALSVGADTAIREVKEGDVLSMIADEYHTTVAFIKKQNGLKSDIIRPGMRLRIWTGRFSVLVDKSQNLLILKSNAEVVKTYRVATGKDNITPVGTFKIINKLLNPTWTKEGKVIPSGDPENILGTRWMGFNIPGYGIHGTTRPESIGQQATAGCVRMTNNDVEELYDLLPVGVEVTVMD